MKLNVTSENMFGFALALFAAYAAMLVPADAWAATDGKASTGGGIEGVLCRVVEWFQGGVGKALATLGIIVIGVGALMGKVSWGMAIIVGIGVGVIFSAGTIVDILSGGSSTGVGCSTSSGGFGITVGGSAKL